MSSCRLSVIGRGCYGRFGLRHFLNFHPPPHSDENPPTGFPPSYLLCASHTLLSRTSATLNLTKRASVFSPCVRRQDSTIDTSSPTRIPAGKMRCQAINGEPTAAMVEAPASYAVGLDDYISVRTLRTFDATPGD